MTVWVLDCPPSVCPSVGATNLPMNNSINVNGLRITTTITENGAEVFGQSVTSCIGYGSFTTNSGALLLGGYGPFIFTMKFDQPVNNIEFVLTATGNNSNENFIFTTNTSAPVVVYSAPDQNCFTTIQGNEIMSGAGSTGLTGGGGGKFRVFSMAPFTELIISGNGGNAGSLISFCSGSLVPFEGSCTKPSTATGLTEESLSLITTQQKSITWAQDVPNGWLVLESKTKGFVITRVADSTIISEPKEGMLIYDESASCVKLYDGTKWGCLDRNCSF